MLDSSKRLQILSFEIETHNIGGVFRNYDVTDSRMNFALTGRLE